MDQGFSQGCRFGNVRTNRNCLVNTVDSSEQCIPEVQAKGAPAWSTLCVHAGSQNIVTVAAQHIPRMRRSRCGRSAAAGAVARLWMLPTPPFAAPPAGDDYPHARNALGLCPQQLVSRPVHRLLLVQPNPVVVMSSTEAAAGGLAVRRFQLAVPPIDSTAWTAPGAALARGWTSGTGSAGPALARRVGRWLLACLPRARRLAALPQAIDPVEPPRHPAGACCT